MVAGTANNGGKDSPGSVITSKASFAHARSIVNDKSSNVFVTHLGFLSLEKRRRTDHTQGTVISDAVSTVSAAFIFQLKG